jgi:SOS response regulatory protein OraA/RecX
VKNLQQEKILENEIEIMANNMEIENAKREMAATKEVLAFKEKQLEELMQILSERGFTADEIKELTK